MANQNPTGKKKSKGAEPPPDREKRVDELAAMVIAAGVLFRQAEAVMAEAVLVAAADMTPEEQTTMIRSVAQATRPYSAAMIRRISNNSEVFGRVAPIWGAS